MDKRPIGMFDSGFGGLTVARAVMDLLPAESLVYVGDTARYPYGDRPAEQVGEFASQIAHWLVEEAGVKMVVVACNTASAIALDRLRGELDVEVIGVIEPGVRAGVAASRTGRIGVIGTVGTVASGAYQNRFAAEEGVQLACAACPGFVEFVERGETDTDQVLVLAERLLGPVRGAEVDTLVLACTHYPFLARTIAEVMGREVVLVSPAEETAFEVRRILSDSGLSAPAGNEPWHRWLCSKDPGHFAALGRMMLGPELASVERVDWEDL